jgi:hypothetical protein
MDVPFPALARAPSKALTRAVVICYGLQLSAELIFCRVNVDRDQKKQIEMQGGQSCSIEA